jgi:hypothetical protein
MQGRYEPEDHRRPQRKPEREQDDRPVEPHVGEAGQVGRGHRDESTYQDEREYETNCSGDRPEDTTFGQQLLHQTATAGAERSAERNLARPDRCAGEQQVRHVGARNEQHDEHGAHQCPQHHLHVAGQSHVQRDENHRSHVILQIRSREIGANGPHLGLRTRDVHARLEPSDGAVTLMAAARSSAGRGPRRPEISGARITKAPALRLRRSPAGCRTR